MRRTNAPALAGPLSFSDGDLPAADAPVGHGPMIRPPIVPIRASCGSLVPRTPASKPLKNHADWYVYSKSYNVFDFSFSDMLNCPTCSPMGKGPHKADRK